MVDKTDKYHPFPNVKEYHAENQFYLISEARFYDSLLERINKAQYEFFNRIPVSSVLENCKQTKDLMRFEFSDGEKDFNSLNVMSEDDLNMNICVLTIVAILSAILLFCGFRKFSAYVDSSPISTTIHFYTNSTKESTNTKVTRRRKRIKSGDQAKISRKMLIHWVYCSLMVFMLHTKAFHLWHEDPKNNTGDPLEDEIGFLNEFVELSRNLTESQVYQIKEYTELFENLQKDFNILRSAWTIALIYLVTSMLFLCFFIDHYQSQSLGTVHITFYILLVIQVYVKVIIPLLCILLHQDSFLFGDNSRILLAHFVTRTF